MMPSSFTVRQRGDGGVSFEVRPAWVSISYVLLSLVGFVLVALIFSILGIFIFQGNPRGLTYCLLGAAVYSYICDWRHIFAGMRFRRRARIEVTASGLSVGGMAPIPPGSIHAIDVRALGASAETAPIVRSSPIYVQYANGVGAAMAGFAGAGLYNAAMQGHAAGYALGAGIRNWARRQQLDTSYLVTLQANAQVVVLAGGLNPRTAESLAQAVGNAIVTVVRSSHAGY